MRKNQNTGENERKTKIITSNPEYSDFYRLHLPLKKTIIGIGN